MGNFGRQAVAGKRLASVHQQISLQGASNVQTARTNEDCTGEAVENAKPPQIPGPFTLRFLTPKKRRATPAEYKAKKCPESPRSTTIVTAASCNRLRETIPGIIGDESLRYQTSRKPRGGLDELYNTSADEGGTPNSFSRYCTAGRALKPQPTRQASEIVEEACPQKQDDTLFPCSASETDLRAGIGDRTAITRKPLYLDSKDRLGHRDVLDGTDELATESIKTAVRVPRPIRLRRRRSVSDHVRPDPKPTPPGPKPLDNPFLVEPGAQGNQAGRALSNERQIGGDQRALHFKTGMEKTGTTASLAASPASAASKNPHPSRIRASGLSFKAKKLRRRFDAGALEAQFGIELSTEGAEKLRTLSGNDMGAALNIYLQGYYKISEDQSPGANKQITRVGKRRSSCGSMASTKHWQEMRQSEKQRQGSHPDMARGETGRTSTLSDGADSVIDVLDGRQAQHNEGKNDPPLSRPDTPEIARELHMTQDDSQRLIQHETSSQEVVPQNRDMRGHREASGASVEDDHAVGARGHFVHAIGVVDSRSPKITETDDKSELSGAGPVPLRGMQGFANQENVRPRNPPSSTNRLPNGKLGACHRLRVTKTFDPWTDAAAI
jgi:hypothetical protein